MQTALRLAAMLVGFSILASQAMSEAWSPWENLGEFKPDASPLIAARTGRGHSEKEYSVQRIAEGKGRAVNVDEYIVRVGKLPKGMSKDALFKHVRINLNDFFDNSVAEFRPLNGGDQADWAAGTDALLGTIMVFEIDLPLGASDDAAVVVSKAGKNNWTFSPVEDGLFGRFGTHPVAGNREFGLREIGGKIEFFTRGFDRVYAFEVNISENTAFEGADKLWRSFQKNLKTFVDANGGTAEIVTPNVPGGNDATAKPQYVDVCKDAKLDLKCP